MVSHVSQHQNDSSKLTLVARHCCTELRDVVAKWEGPDGISTAEGVYGVYVAKSGGSTDTRYCRSRLS